MQMGLLTVARTVKALHKCFQRIQRHIGRYGIDGRLQVLSTRIGTIFIVIMIVVNFLVFIIISRTTIVMHFYIFDHFDEERPLRRRRVAFEVKNGTVVAMVSGMVSVVLEEDIV